MPELVFLLDVDNTLLNNDLLKADLAAQIEDLIGPEAARSFWKTYEKVRRDEQYVDFPATLDRFYEQFPALSHQRLRQLVMSVDFAHYVYPGAYEVINYLKTLGLPVIVSDGDPVFQKMKVEKSGLATRVDGRVVLTVHKQNEMDGVFERFPADHYVLIDDKTSIIADLGRMYGSKVVTVLVRQGKYARQPASPEPDITLGSIRDVMGLSRADFLGASVQPAVG